MYTVHKTWQKKWTNMVKRANGTMKKKKKVTEPSMLCPMSEDWRPKTFSIFPIPYMEYILI